MKRFYIISLLLLSILFVGCEESSSPVSPDEAKSSYMHKVSIEVYIEEYNPESAFVIRPNYGNGYSEQPLADCSYYAEGNILTFEFAYPVDSVKSDRTTFRIESAPKTEVKAPMVKHLIITVFKPIEIKP